MVTEPTEPNTARSQPFAAGAQLNSVAPARPPAPVDEAEDLVLALLPFLIGLLVAALAVGGLFMIAIAQPGWLAPFWASMAGADQKAYWYGSWAGNLYWGSAVSLAGLAVYRIAMPRRSLAAARR